MKNKVFGINSVQLRELINDTLKEIGLYSKEASDLVHGTIAYESLSGHYIRQIKGPAMGIGQMEPFTEDDLWKTYLRYKPNLSARIIMVSSPVELNESLVRIIFKLGKNIVPYFSRFMSIKRSAMRGNLIYAICMVRVKYLRHPKKLPTTLRGQAQLYKEWYNTPQGKGTYAGYVHAFNEYANIG